MEYLPIIISACALLFSVWQFGNRSTKEDSTQITTVIVKLEAISAGIGEIKSEIKSVGDEVKELRERVAKCEGSVASAHKRIDRIEGKEERL